MKATLGPVLIYRWIVFLLAGFYCVYYVVTDDFSSPGGPFRFLTIWALFLSFFIASRHIARMEQRSELRWDGLIGAVTVINAMVCFLYWTLFFEDPNSVTRNGELGIWWKEYYLHALGPFLMWIDAFFLHRAFRKLVASAAWLVGIVVVYLTWGELFVQRFNERPVGTVTTGLPYPFLNNLEFPQRLDYYATNIGVALVLLLIFFVSGWVLSRVLPGDGAP